MIHPDHLATPQKMTDTTGAIVWYADYKPFGDATVTVSTITNNLRFPGQYFDTETGLNYNYYRDYNPIIGRYVETDPLYSGVVQMISSRLRVRAQLLKPERQGDLSLYQYVADNPVNRIDPTGLNWYGNWCGPGGSGPEKDCYDSACAKHDHCYEDCGVDWLSRWNPTRTTSCEWICDAELVKRWKDCALKSCKGTTPVPL